MRGDGDLLPEGHLMTGARGSHEGTTGLVCMHRVVALPRGRHTPGRDCLCSPHVFTTDEMQSPFWLDQPDTLSLPC